MTGFLQEIHLAPLLAAYMLCEQGAESLDNLINKVSGPHFGD
jgi:hypothetical protein